MSTLPNTAFWGECGASWLPTPYREKGPPGLSPHWATSIYFLSHKSILFTNLVVQIHNEVSKLWVSEMITRIKKTKTDWTTFESLTGLDLSSHLLMRAGISKWSTAKNAFFFFIQPALADVSPLKQLCSHSERLKKGTICVLLFLSMTDEIHSKANQEQHKHC